MAAKKELKFDLPKPLVDCAHEGCRTPAILRERLPTGWANLCEFHWLQNATKRADENCKARGLHTLAQRKAFCRQILGSRMPPEREPGSDDDLEIEHHYMPGVKAKEVAGA